MSFCSIQFYPLISDLHRVPSACTYNPPSLLNNTHFLSQKRSQNTLTCHSSPSIIWCQPSLHHSSFPLSQGKPNICVSSALSELSFFLAVIEKICKSKLHTCILTKTFWHWTKDVYYSNIQNSEMWKVETTCMVNHNRNVKNKVFIFCGFI